VTPQPGSAPGAVLELFRQTNAYLEGHFRLTSGLHSPNYLQSALVLQYPRHAEAMGRELASRLLQLSGGVKPNLVISPALGGLIIGHEVARALGLPFLFTERDPDRKMSLRRGFALAPGQKTFVVEDVITTGGSTREVIDIVNAAGAVVLAAGSIIDRSGGAADVGAPRAALETLNVVTWDPSACPLCAAGQPVVKPGSRPV
jgi:orotate phosphoribosyltransferase